MADITIGIAFIAGLVSFISPCVLPLVPAYVGYMGGQVTTQVAATAGGGAVAAHQNRFNTLIHGLFFVLGFTFVFVTFGLLTTAGSLALRGSVVDVQEILTRLGGLVIVLFGLHVMGVLPRVIGWVMGQTGQMNNGVGYAITLAVEVLVGLVLAWSLVTLIPIAIGVGLYAGWLVLGGALTRPGDFWMKTLTRLQTVLYADTRRQMQARSEAGYAGSALMGVVFSAGWTPCIGPVYGAVLTLAANGGSLSQAGLLLTAYSLGLGVPFLLTAVALDRMQGLLRRLQRHMKTIELVSGLFLIVIGVLVLTGQLQQFSQLGSAGDFSINLEHCATELFSGRIGLGEVGACMDAGLNYVPAGQGDAAAPASPGGEAAASGILGSLAPLESADLPAVGLDEGLIAPDFETVTDGNQSFTLSETRGSVIVLNFWATWCGPCRTEMPDLQAAAERYADQDVLVVGVNRAESAGRVAAFRQEFGLTFPLVLDPDERITAGVYQVISMPSTFIVNREGVIVARHLGVLTAEQLERYVQAALDNPTGASPS